MRKIGIIIVLMWLTVGTWAQHLTEQEAMERVAPLKRVGVAETHPSPLPSERLRVGELCSGMGAGKARGARKLVAAKIDAENIYAFNREGGGFIIASADERTLPVLGYSDSGSIDWDRLPENMRAWLMQYDEAIATLGDRTDFKDGNLVIDGSLSRVSTRTAQPAIEPLIKTRWNQVTAPYNNMAPLYAGHNPEWQGQRCPAGCDAVAMAQVLNYWQWPKTLPDGLPAYESVDYLYNNKHSWHIDALPPVVFDWENMLDEYVPLNDSTGDYELLGTEVQQQAVATLLRYCGQAVKSDYFPVVTTSDFFRCKNALVNHFGYAAATWVYPRQQFGIDEWEKMVYAELAAGRPILYGGTSPILDGHAFVCDGYDGNGLFHINWGWQGSDDGYFSLSVLNPNPSTNPNKGSEYLGFTQEQEMIIGLDPTLKELDIPHSEKPELWQYDKMEVLSENTVRFYILYNNDAAETADCALGTIEADGTLNPRFISDPNDSIIYRYSIRIIEIDSTAFYPGETLRLHPMLRFHDVPEAEWQLIPPDTTYVDAGRREDGRFFITNFSYQLEYVSAAITSGFGRIGGSSDLTVTIRNNDQKDYIGNVWLSVEGDRLENGAFIRAGQEGEATFLFTPKHGGQVRFDLSTDYVGYFGSFTMEFDNDTVYSYDPYLVNNSYVTHEGNHYVYHVELCDRPGVTVPDGVPSDSIYLACCISSLDRMVFNIIKIRDEIKDYLRALPDSAGSGNYQFTAKVPLDIEQDGEYFVWSYLIEWLDSEHIEYIFSVEHYQQFPITLEPTAIKEMDDSKSTIDNSIYDLQGRKVITVQPNSQLSTVNSELKKGLYIRKGRKFIK
jgi:hypothetical protein